VLKGVKFIWTPQAQQCFEELNDKLPYAPVLTLPRFDMIIEVECHASGVGIAVVLIQEGRPLTYFSEKLSESRRKYSSYDKEFFAIIRVLGGIEVLIFIYPKRKAHRRVLGVSSIESWVSSTRIQIERLNLCQVKQE